MDKLLFFADYDKCRLCKKSVLEIFRSSDLRWDHREDPLQRAAEEAVKRAR